MVWRTFWEVGFIESGWSDSDIVIEIWLRKLKALGNLCRVFGVKKTLAG